MPPELKLTQEEDSSYYAALTRPISPTMIMNYIPPPISASPGNASNQNGSNSEAPGHLMPPATLAISSTTTAASSVLRPHSATAALSSSFNTLGPGPQPGLRPAMHQGVKNSYIHPSTGSNPASTTITPQQTGITQQNVTATVLSAEDPASNSSRFARRGPLTMNYESGNLGDGTRSRRESATFSDMDSPAANRKQFQVQQQQFSPMSQRTDDTSAMSPVSTGGTQLQTWKRCYAIGRHRGDANPGILTLFKDNETIDMAECFEVQVKGQDAKATGRFEFKVLTRREEAWFATDTMLERTGWIDALHTLMAKAVGASLMKLEAKLNNIRHRNNSLEYTHTATEAVPTEMSPTLEDHLRLVQQDLVTREQQLSQREQELERKRVESLLVQLEAWRAAAKVTVNQHYTVRDQLLERVMKTARTVQELLERAKIHLETGSDQITEVVNSHIECLRVHAAESTLNASSYKMLKSILVGLAVNLDTRSSEIKRVLLTLDQYISSEKSLTTTPTSSSSPTSPILSASPVSVKGRRMSTNGASHYSSASPPPAPSSSVGISVYLFQVRDKYKETLGILEDHSRRLKRVLERADINNPESARRFHEEIRETLKGLLRLPPYGFVPCLPDKPLPGAADTFYREDLVQIQQKSKELLRNGQAQYDISAVQATATEIDAQDSKPGDPAPTTVKDTMEESSSKVATMSEATSDLISKQTAASSNNAPPTVSLALLSPLSSFLLPDNIARTISTADITQKLRDTILPEFDHLSIKQEESLQSMTFLLNQVSSLLVNKLTEIKDATAGQRQEFEDLKDEIIDVMQLSATDPSAHQRDISTLSDVRSKLAEIAEQLTKIQDHNNAQIPQGFYGSGGNGSYRKSGPTSINFNGSSPGNSAATATGFSLLQRSASTMVHSSFGGSRTFDHPIDGGSRPRRVNSTSLQNRLQNTASGSIVAGAGGMGLTALANGGAATISGRQPKIAGMARLFEDGEDYAATETNNYQSSAANMRLQDFDYGHDPRQTPLQNKEVVSRLDQLLLLLEFVNTAQCRMMAYQDLEFDRNSSNGMSNVDDARMTAVQEHMEQMDRKMNLQMNLLRRLVILQGAAVPSSDDQAITQMTKGTRFHESDDEEVVADVELGTSVLLNPFSPDNNESAIRATPSESELSLFEVLNRLDFQVIPSVKDQSSHIQELSDQLSEMKRQLDEQQRRQEQKTTNPPKPHVSTSTNLGRSNSADRLTTPLRARSPSQTLPQQQQQATSLSSPLEIDSPASWRASLRPSHSTGSNSSVARDRTYSTSSPSSLSMNGAQAISGDARNSTLAIRTSDRIAEMLDRMDAKFGLMIDEHLLRFEKGNKGVVSKLYELLDGEDIDNEVRQARRHDTAASRTARNRNSRDATLQGNSSVIDTPLDAISKSDLIPLAEKLSSIEQMLAEQNNHEELQIGDKVLWKETMSSLEELHGHGKISAQAQQQWIIEARGMMESLLSRNGSGALGPDGSSSRLSEVKDSRAELPDQQLWAQSFEKLKNLIQEEADRSESSLNEQRDEILEKMHHIISSIQESQADVGSRDAAVKEELQEMREWIVKHSSMQTENLREIVFAATNPSTFSGNMTTDMSSTSILSGEADAVVIGGRGSSSGSEEEYTKVDILEDLAQDPIPRRIPSMLHHLPDSFAGASVAGSTKEIQELKDQLDMFTKIQMATFSELADNISGVEKMMRDMSKMMGVRRGGTILRKKEAEQGRAMLALEVKETIEEVMTRMNPSSPVGSLSAPNSISGSTAAAQKRGTLRPSVEHDGANINNDKSTTVNGITRGESGLLKYLYQPRKSTSMASTTTPTNSQAQSSAPMSSSIPSTNDVGSVAPLKAVNTTPSPVVELGPQSPQSPLLPMTEYVEDYAQESNRQMQMDLDIYHDQMEQLYRRKVRTEIEVEDLHKEKQRLLEEREELKEQVERLSREKRELLLVRRESETEDAAPATVMKLLESALSDRVAMLLQETARLETLKKQLETEMKSKAAVGQ
ncbi:hypothetical protein BGZ58_001305 [Dissophora ornata]|nr:hypothetical protein BGZ58_001305 [Dissophora ornata]